jgi:hypothetical protein
LHERIRRHLTFANVVSVLALFVALGGGAYAAFHLPKNSVKSKHIVNGQVKEADLQPAERFHDVKLPTGTNLDCTSTPNQWVEIPVGGLFDAPLSYYRDPQGRVYLRGFAQKCGSPPSLILTLPPGYRPAKTVYLPGNLLDEGTNAFTRIQVEPQGGVAVAQLPSGPVERVILDAVSFRCGPSGKNGCP